MRYGFFAGIGGDVETLRAALGLLADCDRLVSLGDLVRGDAEGDLACWERMASEGARALVLGGTGERRFARNGSLPQEVREALRGLPSATLEEGMAILGSPALGSGAPGQRGSRVEAAALGGAPRLVAPLTITPHGGDTRVWRSSGGLARVEEPGGSARIPLVSERLRLELGPSAGAKPVCAVIDLDARLLIVREVVPAARRAIVAEAPKHRPRRRKVDLRQCLLAV